MKVLNTNLLVMDEVIDEVNRQVGEDELDGSMFVYMRDIRGLIPKPIRLKTSEGLGGANSYYPEDTVGYLVELLDAKIQEDDTLKKVEEKFKGKIERFLFDSDIFKKQVEMIFKFQKGIVASFKPVVDGVNKLMHRTKKDEEKQSSDGDLRNNLGLLIRAIDDKEEEKTDELLKEVVFTFNQRLKYQMEEKALEEVIKQFRN